MSIDYAKRTDSGDKARAQGRFGVDHMVSHTTHFSHDPLIGSRTGYVNAGVSKASNLAEQCGGDNVREKILSLIRGGKPRRYGDSRRKTEKGLPPATPPKRDTIIQSAYTGASPMWGKLIAQFGSIGPTERAEIESALEYFNTEAQKLQHTLSAPSGPQVMSAPIFVGFIPE